MSLSLCWTKVKYPSPRRNIIKGVQLWARANDLICVTSPSLEMKRLARTVKARRTLALGSAPKLERGRQPVQALPPIGDLPVESSVLEQVLLPMDKVGKLKRQRRQRRWQAHRKCA
jgi:hypothetical protein